MSFSTQLAQISTNKVSTDHLSKLLHYQAQLWEIFKTPLHSTIARHKIFTFLIRLDSIISQHNSEHTTFQTNSLLTSKMVALPSIEDQVITDPTAILDPYQLSLTRNYYFLLSSFVQQANMDDPADNTLANSHTSNNPTPSLLEKTTITAEDSIETITELLAEMEEDELQVQTQPMEETFQPASQVQPSYFNHRFAIYRKGSTPYVVNALSQVNLFRSFCKSLKTIDPLKYYQCITIVKSIHYPPPIKSMP
jgi:hypothetical protein